MSFCSEFENRNRSKPKDSHDRMVRSMVWKVQDAINVAVEAGEVERVNTLLLKLAMLTESQWYLDRVKAS